MITSKFYLILNRIYLRLQPQLKTPIKVLVCPLSLFILPLCNEIDDQGNNKVLFRGFAFGNKKCQSNQCYLIYFLRFMMVESEIEQEHKAANAFITIDKGMVLNYKI